MILTPIVLHIPFDRYAEIMIPIDLVSLLASLGVLLLYFKRDLPARDPVTDLPIPRQVVRDPLIFHASFPILGLLLIAYFVTAPLHVSVSVVTGAGAPLLLAISGRWWRAGWDAVISNRRVLREAP